MNTIAIVNCHISIIFSNYRIYIYEPNTKYLILVEYLHILKIWNKLPTFDIDSHLPHPLNLSPLLYFSRPTLSVWFNIFSVHHVLQYNSGVLYQLYIVHQAQEWQKRQKAKGKRLRNAHQFTVNLTRPRFFFPVWDWWHIQAIWLLLKILSHIWICVEGQYIYIDNWVQQHPRIVNFNFL